MIDDRLRHWLWAQRIGFCAYRLNQPTFGRLAYRRMLETELRAFVPGPKSNRLGQLSASTLELLLDIHPRRLVPVLKGQRSEWQKALRHLTEAADGGWSVIGGADMIAHHLIFGSEQATSLLRAMQRFLSEWWRFRKGDGELEAAIQNTARALRDPFNLRVYDRTRSKLEAVHTLTKAVRSVPGTKTRWGHVEDVLYHHIFQWPLFTGDDGSYGFSLPVIVEVSFDDRGGDNEPHVIGARTIDLSDWHQSLILSIKAAKELWLSQHRSRGRFVEEVRNASVLVDFGFAEEVISPAREAGENVRLEGRSMEAYFAQVVLSQLVGAPETPVNVATGLLGRAYKVADRTYDYDVDWPLGVEEKLRFAFKTRLFARVVVPATGNGLEIRAGTADRPNAQTASVAHAKRLSNFADVFQTTEWRRDTYIRTPDLLRFGLDLPQPTRRSLEPPSEAVSRCLDLLWKHHQAIVELGGAVAPKDIVETAAFLRQQQRLPLSWTYVRVVADEQDERFWHVIWHAVGASRSEFGPLQWSRSAAAAGARIAAALNQFTPTVSNPAHRAPHVLVLVGAERLASVRDSVPHEVSTTNVTAVLSVLGRELLLPVPNSRAARWIGPTRVILVHDRATTDASSPPADRDLAQVLIRLSLFRFGFTQQMAAFALAALGLRSKDVRNVLNRLVAEGALVDVAGGFYVRHALGQGAARGTRLERARMHFDAAMACAPHLLANDRLPVDLYRAFDPELVHEAQYHLERAFDYAENDIESRELRSLSRSGLLHLARWYDSGGRCSLSTLWRFNLAKDAEDVAQELLGVDDAASSPAVLRFAAAAKLKRALELKQDSVTASGLRVEAATLLEKAVKVSSQEGAERGDYLASLTQFGAFLLKHAGPDQRSRLLDVNAEAVSLVESGWFEGLSPDWCELIGDQEREHGRAAYFYRMSSRAKPSAIAKWTGASALAGHGVLEIEMSLRELEANIDVETCRRWLQGQWSARLLSDPFQYKHVKDRVRTGLPLLHDWLIETRSPAAQ